MRDTLFAPPPTLRNPVSRFSAPSIAYFVCSLIFANLYARFPHVVGKTYHECAAKYGGLVRTKVRSKFASISIYCQFIARRVTVNVLIVNNLLHPYFWRIFNHIWRRYESIYLTFIYVIYKLMKRRNYNYCIIYNYLIIMISINLLQWSVQYLIFILIYVVPRVSNIWYYIIFYYLQPLM